MKTIFCAIHGYTHWEKSLIDIINTVEFQRLKRIKQLAAVHHVYPCATHTRFEHSIGVGHLAEQCCKMLLKHQPYLKGVANAVHMERVYGRHMVHPGALPLRGRRDNLVVCLWLQGGPLCGELPSCRALHRRSSRHRVRLDHQKATHG